MNLRPLVFLPVAVALMSTAATPTLASEQSATETVQASTRLFSSEMSRPETRIPKFVLQNALGIAIIPNVVRAGFVLGGTRGAGVLATRKPNGNWSAPALISLTGGSVGFQVGAQSSDVIIIFNTENGIRRALTQDFDIGGNVTATGGPTGVSPVTGSSTLPDVYTYVRNQQGLFAGVSLQGTKLALQDRRNAQFYNQPSITAQQIFTNPPIVPEAAASLRQVLNRYAPRK